MEGNAYLDFDIRFEKEPNGYRAEVLQSPAGRATSRFTLPFNEIELENFLLKIGQRRSGVRRADSPETKAAREFGSRLFDAIFQETSMQLCFRGSLDEAQRRERGLRIRLRLGDTPELADLPWEYLYHSQPRQFLALSAETPIIRYLDLPDAIKPLAVVPPLRALVMISSPTDFDRLDVEREWQKLREAVKDLEEAGLLVMERLDRATLEDLQRRLRKADYHIFHFIGHGGFDPHTQEGVLVLEDENNRGRLVSGQEIGIYLKDESTLRLAILNACEGARASRSDPFAGAAQSLVLKGIPAVIAMQFEVSDDAAITLAHGFYSAMADGFPVDAALAEARKSVFARGNAVEWGTPVLYLRSPDGRIFNVDRTSTKAAPRPGAQVAELLRAIDGRIEAEDWAGAIARCEDALKLEPANATVRAKLAEARNGQEVLNYYERGARAFETGRWQAAVDAFESAERLRPGFRDLAKRLPETRRRLAESSAPPPLPPPPRQAPPPTPQPHPAPAAARPEPVAVTATAETEFNTARRRSAQTQPPIAKRGGRGWIWVVVGAGAMLFMVVIGAALWEEFGPDDPEPFHPWGQHAQNPPLPPQASAANANVQPVSTSAGNNTAQDAANLLQQAARNLQATPAGYAFQAAGTWDVRMSLMNGRSRVQFDSFGRFTGTASSDLGQAPISGQWGYNPLTSMLSLHYDSGSWLNLPLRTDGQGFAGGAMVDGVWVQFTLQKTQ